MSVYKEGYYIIAEIQERSKQIWNDSCDYGVLVNKNDTLWKNAQQLAAWYGDPKTRNKYYGGVSIEIKLMDEWGWKGTETFVMHFHNFGPSDRKRFKANGFISVGGGEDSDALARFKVSLAMVK